MPLSTALRKLLCCAAVRQQEEETEALPRPARPEPAAAGPVQAGRPYRDFVEGETDRYWREIENAGSLNEAGQQEGGAVALLTEPGQQQAGAAALPEPSRAARGSPEPQARPALSREHMAVIAVQMHLVERGFIKAPYSRLEARPNHVEALIQLAVDAGWQPREIPLPAHPDPQHPAIYYYISDPVSNRPVPREDALIRGDYVYVPGDGSRITPDMYIYPWRGPGVFPTANDLISRGWDACYSLHGEGAGMRLIYHWLTGLLPGRPWITMRVDRFFSIAVTSMHFSPRPPARAEA